MINNLKIHLRHCLDLEHLVRLDLVQNKKVALEEAQFLRVQMNGSSYLVLQDEQVELELNQQDVVDEVEEHDYELALEVHQVARNEAWEVVPSVRLQVVDFHKAVVVAWVVDQVLEDVEEVQNLNDQALEDVEEDKTLLFFNLKNDNNNKSNKG